MKYAAVIVTYNRIELLKECLKCVEDQTLGFDAVIVVNNCSTDGTTEFLLQYKEGRDNTVVINCERNLGGSGGFELGVKSARSDVDYVLLIDDDAMLSLSFMEEINRHLEDTVLAYSGTIMTEGIIDSSHRRRLQSAVLMLKKDVPLCEYKEDSFYYDLSTFCGLVISRKLISLIGYPKGEYFIWYDDTEYSLRMKKYTRIKNINAARINHKTMLFSDDHLSWKSYYGYRNQIDVGRQYSKFPLCYLIYRYSYHYYRILDFGRLAILHPENQYYRECVKIHKAVLRDSKEHILGISNTYYPGKKIV